MSHRGERATVLAAAAAGTVLLGASGCLPSSGTAGTGGPLVVGEHDTSLTFPGTSAGRQVTYLAGGLLPCTDDGQEVTVTGVRATAPVASAEITYYVRRIPEAAERTGGDPIDWAPIVSLDGSAEAARRRGELRGTLAELAAGERLTLECPRGRRDVDAPLDELVVEIRAGAEGASVSDISVVYEVAGRRYTADARLSVEVCGTRVTPPECRGFPPTPASSGPAAEPS